MQESSEQLSMPAQPKFRQPWIRKKVKAATTNFTSKEYSGSKGYNGYWFKHPTRDPEHDHDDQEK